MPLRVLLVQADPQSSQVLSRFFRERGDAVWETTDPVQAETSLDRANPDLVVLDLHLPGSEWLEFLKHVTQAYPSARILITNKHPDFQRELLAREQGARVFLRQPFTPEWIENALSRLVRPNSAPAEEKAPAGEKPLPQVRVPVRIKITLPYAVLALLFAVAGAYLVSQVVLESIQERYASQLVASGKQSADWMVREETRLLETLRLVANTRGMADAVRSGDAERLRQMVLPVAVNSREEAIEVLDTSGTSLLALRHKTGGSPEDYQASRGEALYSGWDFVQPVLNGVVDQGRDKFAGMVEAPWGRMFYVSGPIYAADGSLAGAVLVGRSLQSLALQIRQETLTDTTFYDRSGRPLASTLFSAEDTTQALSPADAQEILTRQDDTSRMRAIRLASVDYSEILGPWEVRAGKDLGLMGTSMAQTFLVQASSVTRAQVFVLVAAAFILVIFIGITLANQITRPLLNVVSASAEVARGNLEVKVDPRGNDEVAVLAHSFNYMVAGLQEGSIYRDLLGRTVSPEVREQLRQTFTSGNLKLEGQEAVATVLMSDIRGFTSLSERVDPATVFKWLNEYFGMLVPVVTSNFGVVNKFDGDAMLAFFGILPKLLNPKQSAYAACCAGVEMLRLIDALNVRRIERGEPPLASGIGINTGVVTAGGLGTSDRLHYTIIGDTVNTAQRLEGLNRQLFASTGVIISHSTFLALGERRLEFNLEPLGLHQVKGKSEKLQVYRLSPLEAADRALKAAVS